MNALNLAPAVAGVTHIGHLAGSQGLANEGPRDDVQAAEAALPFEDWMDRSRVLSQQQWELTRDRRNCASAMFRRLGDMSRLHAELFRFLYEDVFAGKGRSFADAFGHVSRKDRLVGWAVEGEFYVADVWDLKPDGAGNFVMAFPLAYLRSDGEARMRHDAFHISADELRARVDALDAVRARAVARLLAQGGYRNARPGEDVGPGFVGFN